MPTTASAFATDAEPTWPPRSLRVLIADDDRDAVTTLAMLLVEQGHHVREVYRGDAVLRLTIDFRPDVVLLDIGMPGKTGYDVARELKEIYGRNAPVLVAVTGWAQNADRILGQIVGFDHYVTKPYDPKMLLALLAPLASPKIQ